MTAAARPSSPTAPRPLQGKAPTPPDEEQGDRVPTLAESLEHQSQKIAELDSLVRKIAANVSHPPLGDAEGHQGSAGGAGPGADGDGFAECSRLKALEKELGDAARHVHAGARQRSAQTHVPRNKRSIAPSRIDDDLDEAAAAADRMGLLGDSSAPGEAKRALY